MEFGIPSKQKVKTEKYPDHAVITLHPHEGVKTSRKMEFNEKAYSVLGLKEDDTNLIAFSFDRTDLTKNMLINTNTLEIESSLKIAKNGIVSNKKHYNEIKNRYDAKPSDELDLALIATERTYKGQTLFALVTLESVFESELPKAGEDVTEKYKEPETTDAQEVIEETKEEVVTETKSEEVVEEKEEVGVNSEGPGIANIKPAPTQAPEESKEKEEVADAADSSDEDEDDFPF